MFSKKTLSLSVVSALLGGALAVGAPATSAEAACKANVTSKTKHAHYLNLGKQRARTSWSTRAWGKYGFAYRKWSKAKNKGYHTNYNPGSYYHWIVTAYGQPCK
jgi:hypothetical protein